MNFTIKDYQDYLYNTYKEKVIDSSLFMKLVDVIHYAVAIAALNNIDLTNAIMEKDKKASVKYNYKINFENLKKNNY